MSNEMQALKAMLKQNENPKIQLIFILKFHHYNKCFPVIVRLLMML
jgi:hypothetical protein